MYLTHFGFVEKPFQLDSDPRFLWPGPRQLDALNALQYGAEENKGLLLLTGEVGTGKTTLISALTERIADRVVVARLPDPGLTRSEFFHFVADGFGIETDVRTKERFTALLKDFLAEVADSGRKALLIVDEGQIMTPGILREVRLLSNLEIQNRKLLNILLVGQNELLQKLHRIENDAVRKRISMRCSLEPLLRAETEAYIVHRLAAAGRSRRLFTQAAFDEIHAFTGGYPRQINILGDTTLYRAFETGVETIDRRVVVDCEERVRIPEHSAPAAADSRTVQVSPAPPVSLSGRRPAAIGIFLALLLIPCAVLLFGSTRPPRPALDPLALRALISTPYLPIQPAASWLSRADSVPASDRPSASGLQTGQTHSAAPSTPASSPGAADPPPVVIIPHQPSSSAGKPRPDASGPAKLPPRVSSVEDTGVPSENVRTSAAKAAQSPPEAASLGGSPADIPIKPAADIPASVLPAPRKVPVLQPPANVGRPPSAASGTGDPQPGTGPQQSTFAGAPDNRAPAQAGELPPAATSPQSGPSRVQLPSSEIDNPDPAAIFDWLLERRRTP